MVKILGALLAGAICMHGLENDHAQLLQTAAHKGRMTKRNRGLDDVIECREFDWSVTCPLSAMTDLEAAYDEDEESLNLIIAGLEADIDKEVELVAKVNSSTEAMAEKTASALAQAAKIGADIVVIEGKMDEMTLKFEAQSAKLQQTMDDLDAQIQNVGSNAAALMTFLSHNPTPGDTGLLQTNILGLFNWKKMFEAIEEIAIEVKEVVQEIVVDVVDEVDEGLQENLDRILAFKVDEAREEFASKKQVLELQVSTLTQKLATEQGILTDALAAQDDQKANLTAALAEKKQVKEAFKTVKQAKAEMKEANKQSLATLKAEINLMKIWMETFKAKFGSGLFKQLSRNDLVLSD